MPHAVVVTGGRNYSDRPLVRDVIDHLPDGTLVINGGAPGADELCVEAAKSRGLPYMTMPYFKHLGSAGGPVRNWKMLDVLRALREYGYTVQVIAFPGGRGTANCVEQARGYGLPVVHALTPTDVS